MYTVPLIFMFFGFTFSVRVIGQKRKSDILLASAWAEDTSCIFKRIAGALVNAAVPGNFARQGRVGAEIDLILVVKNSGIAVASGFQGLIRNLPLLLVIVVCVFAGSLYVGIKAHEIICVMIYCAAGLLIIDFPVLIAYGYIYLEQRALFV